jgi:hypothetical protein
LKPIAFSLAVACMQVPAAFAQHPPCKANADFTAVDIRMPVQEIKLETGKTGVDALKALGVKTIIRYYDWQDESIACKTLLKDEIDEIFARGMSVAVVFQHNNDDPETFIHPSRGGTDAKRALKLAEANGQPYGTAIYFGVDGVDATLESLAYEDYKSDGKEITPARKEALMGGSNGMSKADFAKHSRFYSRFLSYRERVFNRPAKALKAKDMLPFVDSYFDAVNAEFDEAAGGDPAKRYVVGAYGSGLVCRHLASKVKYCWLAQSQGWPEYSTYKDGKQWSLLQKLITTCPWAYPREEAKSVGFDFNVVHPDKPDFGQWSARREPTVTVPRPTKCPAL